jgi:hypothetical protein
MHPSHHQAKKNENATQCYLNALNAALAQSFFLEERGGKEEEERELQREKMMEDHGVLSGEEGDSWEGAYELMRA